MFDILIILVVSGIAIFGIVIMVGFCMAAWQQAARKERHERWIDEQIKRDTKGEEG